ncbi:hypothetical protein ACOZ38_10855 [Sphaerisporangium viridialbum]|uniref:hypothetical protein n=1 Tax=Sphaerisporangium viridialbum TaxID=46189 RepID=UPI003C70B432
MPFGVDAEVESVSAEEPPEVTEAGLKFAVVPLGSPDAVVRFTVRTGTTWYDAPDLVVMGESTCA